jgi:hypothetical protein
VSTQYVSVVGGAAVSSAVALDPTAGAFAVFVASHTPVSIAVDFSTVSGGAGELSWYRLEETLISSTTPPPAVGIVARAASPWVRLHIVGTNATTTVSACLVPVKV